MDTISNSPKYNKFLKACRVIASTEADRSESGSLCEMYLGESQLPNRIDPIYQTRSDTKQSLYDIYGDAQMPVLQLMVRVCTDAILNATWIPEIATIKRTNVVDAQVVTHINNNDISSIVPIGGVPDVLTHLTEVHQGKAVRHGIGIEVWDNMFTTEAGVLFWIYSIDCAFSAITRTQYMMVADALFNHPQYIRIERPASDYSGRLSSFFRKRQEFWHIVAKRSNGLNQLSSMIDQNVERDAVLDRLIIPISINGYLQYAPENMNYDKHGNKTSTSNGHDSSRYYKTIQDNVVHIAKSFGDNQYHQQTAQIGEFYIVDAREDSFRDGRYNSKELSVQIYSEDRDDLVTIDAKTMLSNCIEFGKDGGVQSVSDLMENRSNSLGSADMAEDWLTNLSDNGADVPVGVIGDIEPYKTVRRGYENAELPIYPHDMFINHALTLQNLLKGDGILGTWTIQEGSRVFNRGIERLRELSNVTLETSSRDWLIDLSRGRSELIDSDQGRYWEQSNNYNRLSQWADTSSYDFSYLLGRGVLPFGAANFQSLQSIAKVATAHPSLAGFLEDVKRFVSLVGSMTKSIASIHKSDVRVSPLDPKFTRSILSKPRSENVMFDNLINSNRCYVFLLPPQKESDLNVRKFDKDDLIYHQRTIEEAKGYVDFIKKSKQLSESYGAQIRGGFDADRSVSGLVQNVAQAHGNVGGGGNGGDAELNKELQREISDKTMELRQRSIETEQLRKKLDNAQADLKKYDEKIAELERDRNANNDEKIKKLNSQLVIKENQTIQLETKLGEFERIIQQLKGELTQLKNSQSSSSTPRATQSPPTTTTPVS